MVWAVSDNHYFNKDPKSASKLQEVDIALGGRQLKLLTDSGVFSSSGLDKGTQILLRHSGEAIASGKILDLGAGWGPISIELAIIRPGAEILSVEINNRAIELLEKNIASASVTNVQSTSLSKIAERSIDQIWSNPPIRIGKQNLHNLLIEAFGKLRDGGKAYLVVQKHLGSDSLANWIEKELGHLVERIDNSKGFRVFRVTKQQLRL
jgi:16S RNA G1207 methylase RsmC